jgi:CheY-like chemotaxis protein/anti-sigma regulatory factor (Ser/Thr protein kinase)
MAYLLPVADGPKGRRAGKKAANDPHTDVTGALHDVSNALTVLLGWVAEARAPTATEESIEHALGVIEHRARSARDLARRAIGAQPAIVDLDASLEIVLDEVLDLLAVEAQRTNVRLGRSGHASVRIALPGDVAQIVTNVVLNALAHAPRSSTIAIEVTTAPNAVTLDIQDQGPGIADDRRARIFDGDSARPGGAGVGLRHSRALARAAGGDLELVPSTGPAGARFRLTWPREDATIAPPASVPAPPLLKGTRILVVEDDEHVTFLLETALGGRGAVVTVARNAEELAKALEAGEHDAALVDLSPIAADVEGAIAALRKRSPNVALVFISGSAVGLPGALEAESVRWVRKPFEVNELVAALVAARESRR